MKNLLSNGSIKENKIEMLKKTLNNREGRKHYSQVKLALAINYDWETTLLELHTICNSRPDLFSTNGDYIELRPKYMKMSKEELKSIKDKNLAVNYEKHNAIKLWKERQKDQMRKNLT